MPDIDIIINAKDRASGAIKDVNSELKHLDGHSKGLPGPLGALSKVLGTGLAVAAGAAAAAIGGLGVGMAKSISAAAGMEQAVADIMAVMGKTAPPIEDLNKAIQDLGLDPKLKVSAVDAAKAINMLAKNGVVWNDIQKGMAKSTVLLANATNDDFALAADVATNAMVQFNRSTADMDGVINGIIGVTQASQFGIEDYAYALASAGGVAGSVGVDFEDFNAAIAATSSYFASGSDAGTSFKVFLQRLVPDTDPAFYAMKKLGLITAEGGSAFFDAAGQMKSMSDIAELLQNATAGLSEEQKIQTLTTIFGTDAQRTAFAMAASGAETIDELKGVIGDTSAEDAAATRMDTLKGSWEIFTGVVDTLSIQFGEVFLPVVRDVVEWLTALASEHGPKVVEAFQYLTENFGDLTTLWEDGSTVLGTFLEKLGMSEETANTIGQAFVNLASTMQTQWENIKGVYDLITDGIAEVRTAWDEDWGFMRSTWEKFNTDIPRQHEEFWAQWHKTFGTNSEQNGLNWEAFFERLRVTMDVWNQNAVILQEQNHRQWLAFLQAVEHDIKFWTALMGGDWDTAWIELQRTANSAMNIILNDVELVFGPQLRNNIVGILQGITNVFASFAHEFVVAWNLMWEGLGHLPDLTNAGREFMANMWEGVTGYWRNTVEPRWREKTQWLADMLPGSEPKDPSSPLRGLASRGEALMRNFATGMEAGAMPMRNTFSAGLASMAATTNNNTTNYNMTMQFANGGYTQGSEFADGFIETLHFRGGTGL